MHLHSGGATDALIARHSVPGTALALIKMPGVPALSPGHKKRSHDVIDKSPSAMKQLAVGIDVRHISPREISDFGLDLYAAGAISFEDYSALSQHPELNPHFDKTIGALTNEKARPEFKRDLVRYWEEKMAFTKRYESIDRETREQAKRIVSLMRYLSRRVLRPTG